MSVQVLIQKQHDRVVYIHTNTDGQVVGLNFRYGYMSEIDWSTPSDGGLYKIFLNISNRPSVKANKRSITLFELIDMAIEEYSAPKYYLIFSLNDNKLYSLEVLHGEVDREDLPRYISNKIRGDFEFMEVNSDYEAGNMVELCKL